MSDHLGAARIVRDRRSIERDVDSGPSLPDPRHLDTDAMRAQIGVVYCRTCRQDCLPLNNGTCGWCGLLPDGSAAPTPVAAPAPAGMRACSVCKTLFEIPSGAAQRKRYCTPRCQQRAFRARNPRIRNAE